ncbi:unnamed protein product, partial [Symbiodinium necroappetens]
VLWRPSENFQPRSPRKPKPNPCSPCRGLCRYRRKPPSLQPLPAKPKAVSPSRPPASGQAGYPKVPVPEKELPGTPLKPKLQNNQTEDVSMSPPVPKAAGKPPSPTKDVQMSTPGPAKFGTPVKPGYTPIKSPDYKKARKTLFADEEVPSSMSQPEEVQPGSGPGPSIRRPDSLTTVARSTSTLVLGDFPEAEEEPSTSRRRLIFEGYYGMPCTDKQWPPLQEVQDASSMMPWMQDALPRHPERGVVSLDQCRSDLLVDMQGLPYRLQFINAAWVQVGSFQALKTKTATMLAAVHNQSEQMIHKLRQQLDNGELDEGLLHRRASATEQWRSKKTKEIEAHLDKAEMDVEEQLFMSELEEAMGKVTLDE